jgi:hypothetical protein
MPCSAWSISAMPWTTRSMAAQHEWAFYCLPHAMPIQIRVAVRSLCVGCRWISSARHWRPDEEGLCLFEEAVDHRWGGGKNLDFRLVAAIYAVSHAQ